MNKRNAAFAGLGLAAAFCGIAVGEIIAAAQDSAFAPIQVVASSAIDLPPAPVKEWATATFGTASKYIVVLIVVLAVAALAAWAGVLARTRTWAGIGVMLGLGAVGVVAGVLRPIDGQLTVLPSIIAGITAAIALGLLVRASASPTSDDFSGRRALLGSAVVIGIGVLAVGAARYTTSRTSAAVNRLTALLPRPVEPLPPIPASAQAPVAGMTSFITPNDEFYKIDTSVVVPQVSTDEWKLTFDGMVNRSYSITYKELLELPMIERDITIMCVSNPIGGDYIGTARWLGTPLMPLLMNAGIQSTADQLLSESIDGWTCSTPLVGLADHEPMLAIGMNGEPLPIDHGYPVRMIIPGLYGFISATKWVTRITATTYADRPAYWTVRGWATDAPVLTGSRLDLPRQPVSAGDQVLAGVAWAMDGEGISAVEVKIDDGPWLPANLADQPSERAWRQWWLPWQAQTGDHEVQVRAVNGLGEVQTGERRPSIPAGATGYDTRIVTVT